MQKEEKKRLSRVLKEKGVFHSTERAAYAIKNEGALVNGKIVFKPGYKVKESDQVSFLKSDFPWVSRGGIKLERAFEIWKLDAKGKTCADVGASTGGFTDVLLHYGAKKVYAVDTGSDQLHWKIKKRSEVINLEGVDFRKVGEDIKEEVDLIAIDVSYISLTLLFKKAKVILKADGVIVALVKPQFEVGNIGETRKGIVKEESQRKEAVEKVKSFARETGLAFQQVEESPILGKKGNKEFLMLLKKK